MSDNARRFMAVRKTLLENYPAQGSRRLSRHLTTLAALIAGIVGAQSTHLNQIAQKAPDRTLAESRTRRFARWLSREQTTYEGFYLPWARQLAAALAQHGPLVVIFDGSTLGRGCSTLMASLVYKRRALPLVWSVKRGKKGSFSAEHHLDLLDALGKIVPAEAAVVFLGDGEFDSVELQQGLARAGYDYVCRTSKATRVSDGVTDCMLGELAPLVEERYAVLPAASVTGAAYGPVTVLVWHERRYQEPIFLVTNLEVAEEAIYWYRRRFRIETLFSDQKSRGFHVHKSHLSHPERLARLLIATSLAYVWIIYLGGEALQRGYVWLVHRRDRLDLSLFQLGLRALEYLLNEGKRVLVAFNVLPPPQTVR